MRVAAAFLVVLLLGCSEPTTTETSAQIPATSTNPTSTTVIAVGTTITATGSPDTTSATGCEPAYPAICVPPGATLLPTTNHDGSSLVVLPSCFELDRGFDVPGDDPYHFDADGDGVGCESGETIPLDPACDPAIHEPFPGAVAWLFARIDLPRGLCLQYFSSMPSWVTFGEPCLLPSSNDCHGGFYSSSRRLVGIVTGTLSETGVADDWIEDASLRLITHELCHAHQQEVVLDAGLGGIESFYLTGEGRDFATMNEWSRLTATGGWRPLDQATAVPANAAELNAHCFAWDGWWQRVLGLPPDPATKPDEILPYSVIGTTELAFGERWWQIWDKPTTRYPVEWVELNDQTREALEEARMREINRTMNPALRTPTTVLKAEMNCFAFKTFAQVGYEDWAKLRNALQTLVGEINVAAQRDDLALLSQLSAQAGAQGGAWRSFQAWLTELLSVPADVVPQGYPPPALDQAADAESLIGVVATMLQSATSAADLLEQYAAQLDTGIDSIASQFGLETRLALDPVDGWIPPEGLSCAT